jgi:PAS domain S-box-containing protein
MTTPEPLDIGTAKRIVFADNDPILLEAIPEVLQAKGYEVHTAQDGLEALQAVRRLKPAYLILDIVMPKIDGSRVCWLIRQDPSLRNTPIIAFSALGPEQIARFPELSADAYVAKGPLAVVANNLLAAIKYLEERGRGDLQGGIFGYEGFQSRRLVSEMLSLRRYWETLVRVFEHGVLALDEEGRVLLINPAAIRLFGRKEMSVIGEPLPALLASRDRDVLQKALGELKRARLPQDIRIELSVRGERVRLRLSSIIEDGACSGMLVVVDSRKAPSETPA